MRVRLMGTEEECQRGAVVLCGVFVVRETSGWCPNRGSSVLGRVYLEVEVA